MKKVIAMLCTALFAAVALADTWTDPATGITWTYTVGGGKASVGSGSMESPAVPTLTTGAITIPSTLGGYPVTSIGEYAFRACSALTSVTIPSSVTSIGDSAFFGCSGLTSVTIPSSVTSINEYAFCDCSGLESVTIPSSVTSIGSAAFYYCTGLESVTIPSSVTSIGSAAFNCCTGLVSVTIPSSVTSIGDSAFFDCSGLTSVTIPSSVTSIGKYTFWGCSGLTSVTIPSSVTSIGYGAFQYCSALTSVTIPSSVTSIDGGVFEGCYELKTVYVDAGYIAAVKGLYDWESDVQFVERGNMPTPTPTPTPGPVVQAVSENEVSESAVVTKATTIAGCVLSDGEVVGSVEIKVTKEGAKGSKITGSVTMLGGKKLTAKMTDSKATVKLSEGPAVVEMTVKGLGTMSIKLGATAEGDLAFTGTLGSYVVTSAAIGGEITKSAVFYLDGELPTTISGYEVNGDYSPDGEKVTMNGKKWTLAKAATIKYAKDKTTKEYGWVVNGGKSDPNKTNLSALKLTYTAKTGAFKGSFYVYTLKGTKLKKLTAKVAGIVVDGVGYGTATIKGAEAIAIVIK